MKRLSEELEQARHNATAKKHLNVAQKVLWDRIITQLNRFRSHFLFFNNTEASLVAEANDKIHIFWSDT